MAILGISSATNSISTALTSGGALLAEITLSGKRAFTEDIVLYVKKMAEESNAIIDGVAVVAGPGAYSGLRGGLAFAKTFAQVNKISLAAVSTLHVLALNLAGADCLIGAVTDACKDDYNFALFRSRKGKVERLTKDLVIHFDKLCGFLSRIRKEIYLTGNCGEVMAKVAELNPDTKIAVGHFNIPTGFNTALIGEKMIREGKISDPLKLMPNYSHDPNIREFKT